MLEPSEPSDFVIMIGNSDDKLTQQHWAKFCEELETMIRRYAQVHGVWFSASSSVFQNMAICGHANWDSHKYIQIRLKQMAFDYGQDSIAMLSGTTEFINFLGADLNAA